MSETGLRQYSISSNCGPCLQTAEFSAADDFLPVFRDITRSVAGINYQPRVASHKLVIKRGMVCSNEHGIIPRKGFGTKFY